MQTLLVAALVAFTVAMLVIRYGRRRFPLIADSVHGVQKFHAGRVPRVGGAAVLAGMVAALAWSAWRGLIGQAAFALVVAVVPVFAAGLGEDITKRIPPRVRLLAAAVSAALAAWLLDAWLPRIGLPWLDPWLQPTGTYGLTVSPVAMALTLFAVTGLTHAINIIDGFNGLAAAAGVLMFGAFGYVAWSLGDALLLQICLSVIGALLGFLAWNYPRGLIFLGDGGAYLIGFVLAQVAVLLVVRHPALSPWFPLLVCLYPIVETLFSIYRKRVVRGVSPSMPDALHLHMLIYRRLIRWAAGPRAARDFTRRNAATAPYLWGLTSVAVVPAVIFWQHPVALVSCTVGFVAVYCALYAKLVRFRSPKWLRRRLRSH